jgi:hypothetical protein
MLINIACPFEQAAGLPFTTQPSHDDIDVFFFDQIAFDEATPSGLFTSDLKTSFSRLNPGPRG